MTGSSLHALETPKNGIARPFTVLITSVGVKVGLIRAFKEHPLARVVGIDTDPLAPAASFCDIFYTVPPTDAPNFPEALRNICQRENIALIVPTRAEDFCFWSLIPHDDWPPIALSKRACLDVCTSKHALAKFLQKNSLPFVETRFIQDGTAHWHFPLIAKPNTGSGSRGVRLIYCQEELAYLPQDWVLQPRLEGQEYTLNAYVSKKGTCPCIIPHIRQQVIGGEVDRGMTVRIPALITLAGKLLQALPGAYGPLNIQAFYDPQTQKILGVTDINPRFGGGYPLVHAAGAHFTHWLINEARGEAIPSSFHWKENIQLVRYHESMFLFPK